MEQKTTKTELQAEIAKRHPKHGQKAKDDKWTKDDMLEWFDLWGMGFWEGDGSTQAETLKKYREKYQNSTTAKGRASKNNGDELADLLSGLEPEEVVSLAERVLNLEPGTLEAKYERLNPGQQRMNSGNRIRAAIKRGDVSFDDVSIAALI